MTWILKNLVSSTNNAKVKFLHWSNLSESNQLLVMMNINIVSVMRIRLNKPRQGSKKKSKPKRVIKLTLNQNRLTTHNANWFHYQNPNKLNNRIQSKSFILIHHPFKTKLHSVQLLTARSFRNNQPLGQLKSLIILQLRSKIKVIKIQQFRL